MLDHKKYMDLCLELARQAEGHTSPNPLVGAIVVSDDGQIIARGFHQAAGLAHAEVLALDAAGDAASGQTLYVNLEPCCHHGRTGPCTERVIASGIKRVVAGMQDPNPKVAGAGLKALAAAGIEVVCPIGEKESRWLNRGFIKWMKLKKPWTCLKMATTLDGRIADRESNSRWITGPEARKHVHDLRSKYDCVVVGGTTAIVDDPQLNVRDVEGRDPVAVVIDPQLNISSDSRLFKTTSGPIIFALAQSIEEKGKRYPSSAQIVPLPQDESGRLDLTSAMQWLASKNNLTALCEGGGRLAGSLLEAGLVDEVHWIIAPKLICDGLSIPSMDGLLPVPIEEAFKLENPTVTRLGEDTLISGVTRFGLSALE